MPWPRLLPALLALLVLAAHFYRAGLAHVVPACIGLAALLCVRLAWVPRAIVVALLLAAVEWLRTLALLAGARMEAGQPFMRLVVILAGVALLTLLAAWPLRSATVRQWYRGGP